MRVRVLAAVAGALLLTASSSFAVLARSGPGLRAPVGSAAPADAYIRLDRFIEPADIGLRLARGITFARESGALLVTGTRTDGSSGLLTVSLLEQLQGSTALPSGLPAAADLAYDSVRDSLVATIDADSLLAVPAANGLVQPGATGAASTVQGQSEAAAPTGVEVSSAGETLVLDASGTVSVSRPASATTATVVDEVSLSGVGEALSGLAVASDGHLFSVGPASSTLYEFASNGALLARRDLARLGVVSPQDLAIAPSADTSDAATIQNVYVTDAGAADGTGAGIAELALAAPVLSPQVAAAAVSSASFVDSFNTGQGSAWNPDSPDPSGLTYVGAGEPGGANRTDRLVSADGEVEETTGAGFNNVNVWFAPRDGSTQTETMNTTKAPTNPVNKEPVGVAYDPVRNELYISKDGAGSSGGRVWVYNVATEAQVRTFTVTGAPYNNRDAEGLAFGDGNLYMVDAIDNDLVKVAPGNNNVVGSGGDDVVTNYDLQQYGQTEPEGLDVHPTTGNVWIVSNKVGDPMIEVTPNGALASTTSIGAANPNSPAGLAIAPSSPGSGLSVYIADRGIDNAQNPNENDGRIYEFSLGSGGPPPPTADFTWTQVAGTQNVSFTDTSTESPHTWLWDFDDGTSGQPEHSAQNPTHTYADPGTYQVTLTATNNNGSDSVTKTVTVTDPTPAPTADFTWTQVAGTQNVSFTDTSTESPHTWLWDFDDGTSGQPEHSAQNPTHTYADPGTYQVTLTATNNNGSDSVTKTVTVTDPAGSSNLLLNPSFELDANGDGPDNWTTNNKFTRFAFATPHDGAWVGRHLATNDAGYSVLQQVSATAGATYNLSTWIFVPPTSDAFTLTLKLRWLNSSGATISTQSIGTVTAATGGVWVERAGSRPAPAQTAAVQVMMTLSSLNATVYVDDFSLTGP